MPAELAADDLKARLNLETGLVPWRELQTFFARGQVVLVAPSLNLLEVGEYLADDDKQRFEQWMEAGTVGEVPVKQAQSWYDADADLWAMVVAPWVLVQDRAERH